jgi:two-component system sensor histidine kinase ChvG
MVLDVLDGSPKAATRRSVDDKVKIVMAGHPIRSGNSVLGAVVVEQSSNAILTRQYELLKSLAAASLLVFAFVTITLIIFAWRLTVRIGRLRDTTEQAITREGRVQELLIPNRHYPRDELGDLGRSITSMLKRLSGYTQYLEGLPDTLAHELNNPLNVVSSSLQNLEQEQGNLSDNKYMERAQTGVNRLRHILTSLTEAANLEEAMQSEEKEPISLGRLLEDYIGGARSIYPKHTFDLVVAHEPTVVLASGEHIAELLDKLIDNAVHFGDEAEPINVRLKLKSSRLIISVANHGPQVDIELQDRIFEPMVSLGRKDAKQSHLGLGLYVVRLISEFHEARATMRNTSKGVVVSVSFPAMD